MYPMWLYFVVVFVECPGGMKKVYETRIVHENQSSRYFSSPINSYLKPESGYKVPGRWDRVGYYHVSVSERLDSPMHK